MEPNDPLWRVTGMQTTAEARHDEVDALYADNCARLIGLLILIGGSHSQTSLSWS